MNCLKWKVMISSFKLVYHVGSQQKTDDMLK